MSLLACEVPGALGSVEGNVALLEKDGHITGAAVLGSGVELKGKTAASLPQSHRPCRRTSFTWESGVDPRQTLASCFNFPN